jgi:hypothetical protein
VEEDTALRKGSVWTSGSKLGGRGGRISIIVFGRRAETLEDRSGISDIELGRGSIAISQEGSVPLSSLFEVRVNFGSRNISESSSFSLNWL